VDAARTLPERLFPYDPGDTVTLTVIRGDETLEIDVTLGGAFRLPEPDTAPPVPEAEDNA